MIMKKEYIKPSIQTVELENGACILAGSLNGSVGEQQNIIQYGGDTSNENVNKDDEGNVWGD
jgi:hypothetical protein